MAGDEDARLEAVRKRTKAEITHPDRVLYPAAGLTKLDVIEYYLEVAPFLLPYLHGRPITMHRFPGGVGEAGFYEKDAPAGTLAFVETFTHWAEAPGRDVRFVLCNNLDTLAWLANIAALELHTTLSRATAYDSPDLLFVDIDPEPPFDFDEVIAIARIVRDHLEGRGLRSFVKTSGKKGLHIVVPLAAGHTFDALREFVHGIGKAVARDTPHVVSEFNRSREKGTVFVDYLQNATGKTMVAPYSLRATPSATVSAPLEWEDLRRGVRPEDFTYKTILARQEDPWRDLFGDRQAVPWPFRSS
ncbi:MAG: non-homologous end-joining DNA ligase [Methanospirillum sp.]